MEVDLSIVVVTFYNEGSQLRECVERRRGK